MTEEEIRKIFKDEFEKFYRRKYPTFQVTGGGPSVKHGKTEYALTTNEAQILHFYEGGVGKLASNRSFEIYSGHDADVANGEVTGEGAIAIKLECRNGRIHIEAKSSDIELNGRNISLVAQQNIYLNAGKNIKTNSLQIFINGGGAVGIHCESEVIHTSSGIDEDMAPDFYQDITPFHDESPPALSKIDSYNQNDG